MLWEFDYPHRDSLISILSGCYSIAVFSDFVSGVLTESRDILKLGFHPHLQALKSKKSQNVFKVISLY